MHKSIDWEKLLPLVKAVEDVTGHRPHLATCCRWATTGSKGIVLRTQMIGGRRMTKPSWVEEFFEATTQAASNRIRLVNEAIHPSMEIAKQDLRRIVERTGKKSSVH